jgi:hypothetical protein
MPFVEPVANTEPASVVTDAVEISMRRIMLLPESATKAKEPVGEMLTPRTELNREFVPMPFVEPEDSAKPARVVTEVVERSIIRMTTESTTRAKRPVGEMLIASGLLN